MSALRDAYKTLGVTQTTPSEEIDRRFRELARQHHPDKGGDEKLFNIVVRAYDMICDAREMPVRPERYDGFKQQVMRILEKHNIGVIKVTQNPQGRIREVRGGRLYAFDLRRVEESNLPFVKKLLIDTVQRHLQTKLWLGPNRIPNPERIADVRNRRLLLSGPTGPRYVTVDRVHTVVEHQVRSAKGNRLSKDDPHGSILVIDQPTHAFKCFLDDRIREQNAGLLGYTR